MGAKKVQKGNDEHATARLFRPDCEDLSGLADLLDVTVAELYREACAPIIRERRIKAMEAQLKSLRNQS